MSFSPTRPTHITLTDQEEAFVQQLSSLSPHAIRRGATEKTQCQQIGLEIFTTYRNQNQGNSSAGKAALQKIHSALSPETLREAVRNAWAGVGDNSCRWMA